MDFTLPKQPKVTSRRPHKSSPAPRDLIDSVPNRLLALQRKIGNQCIVALLASRKVQTKLAIGEPDDKYEVEADQVADQIMRMPAAEIGPNYIDPASLQSKAATIPSVPLNHPISDSVQEHVDKQAVHAKQQISQQTSGPYVEPKFDFLKGGHPLPESTRHFFEPRFGNAFRKVRIHTGQHAGELANAVKASAFTLGKDVIFGPNQYMPSTEAGKWLIAHELAHVIQQGEGRPIKPDRSNHTARPASLNTAPDSVATKGSTLPEPDLVQNNRSGRHIQRNIWSRVPGDFQINNRPLRIFHNNLPAGTTLATALEWIFTHSISNPTQFQYDAPSEQAAAMAYANLSQYQEVALAWHLQNHQFTAFTIRRDARTVIHPRTGVVFVAHTHPTPQDLPPSNIVSWSTNQPSPGDLNSWVGGQRYSIICHRDLQRNTDPRAFIYDISGNVITRYSGSNAFRDVANQYLNLSQQANSVGRNVGQYP